MKVDFIIGTKGKASYFTAKYIYVGRFNENCNHLCYVLVNAMANTYEVAAKEAKITDEQMAAAKAMSETMPIHVELDVSIINGRINCKVSYHPEKNPQNSTPKQSRTAYMFADCLCEYVKEYAKQARNGSDKDLVPYKNMNFIREMPKWDLNG